MRHAVRGRTDRIGFSLLTLELNCPGRSWLFRSGGGDPRRGRIALGALSSFSRDHLLVKQADLGKALRVLGDHVAELC